MTTRRKSIPLSRHEDGLLRQLYLIYRVPSDQFKRRPQAVARYLKDWNALSGRIDCWEDVYHYIITKRKNGEWPTLDGDYHPMPEPNWALLSAREWRALEEVYASVVLARGLGSDALLFDCALSAELAREFTRRVGKSRPSAILTALIVSKRKRGEWIHMKSGEEGDDLGFSDINQIA